MGGLDSTRDADQLKDWGGQRESRVVWSGLSSAVSGWVGGWSPLVSPSSSPGRAAPATGEGTLEYSTAQQSRDLFLFKFPACTPLIDVKSEVDPPVVDKTALILSYVVQYSSGSITDNQ